MTQAINLIFDFLRTVRCHLLLCVHWLMLICCF